jgi:tRNA C32,U32 (ribose-2'-O)-methylase TrmJ
LLTPSQTDRIDVVLVSPRNPLNIGAAARAMANFGFRRLSIVAPFAMNWMEAKSAVGAPNLLRSAQVFETLAEAIAHSTLVLGTGSLDKRKPVQTILSLPEAATQIRATLETTKTSNSLKGTGVEENAGSAVDPGIVDGTGIEEDIGLSEGYGLQPVHQPRQIDRTLAPEASSARIALLFGSEKHGLTTEDLSWCHALIVIDTHQDQPSMNLGQAVAVCLYEISRDPNQVPAPQNQSADLLRITSAEHPDSAQLDRLAGLIEETMEVVNYSTRGIRSANGEALRVLLRRLMPNEADLRRMMGLFRRILWQLRRQSDKL